MERPLAAVQFVDGGSDTLPIDAFAFTRSIVRSLARLRPHLPEDKRGGGVYACVVVRRGVVSLPPAFWSMIGLVYEDKMPRYHPFSREKVDRTFQNPGHVLSWQSMDDAAEQYPGAAVAHLASNLSIGVGISGKPSAADEAVAIRSLLDTGFITADQAEAYAAISSNPYWCHLR